MDLVYRRLWRRVVYRIQAADISPASAEQLAQDVFLNAHRKQLQLGSPKQGLVRLIWQIKHGLVANYRRHKQIMGIRVDAEPDELAEEPPASVPWSSAELSRENVDGILAEMKPWAQEVIRLADLDGLSLAAIASAQGLPEATVRSRHARARKAFEELARQRIAGTAPKGKR